ncbi:hypothetical protein RBH29_06165 [Herbivorax sp. ANBcel31]|uniref:hypothetical protein n=1 Tax=Herbivorax sp. ANBcel31 TaxID=3069754 RepID=UPI0027B67E80|nr:hypothetical protein [Herbivorax sp. ANBcel31]MDQ2086025.1 hypothetical protein [Herbivorax sp. ANBcel31]
MYNKKGKNSIWIYAIILFTCAFILLLLTGYSQIKFNKDIDDYRNKLMSSEEEKNISSHNLRTALEENEMLYERIEELNNILKEKEADYGEIKQNLKNKEIKKNQLISNYELMLKAEEHYNNGKITKSAVILLEDVNKNKLNKNGLKKYNDLKDKIYEEAAWEFYKKGYDKYINKEYEDAKFNLYYSLDITEDEFFSDDCHYYIAYSGYRMGEYDLAREYIKMLMTKYPSSNYIEEAKNLLIIIENE